MYWMNFFSFWKDIILFIFYILKPAKKTKTKQNKNKTSLQFFFAKQSFKLKIIKRIVATLHNIQEYIFSKEAVNIMQ